jgi:hypothetical protein
MRQPMRQPQRQPQRQPMRQPMRQHEFDLSANSTCEEGGMGCVRAFV